MDYRLEDLIDIPLLQSLQDKLNVIYSFTSAIIDNEGKVLTAVAWQDMCTKFHRTNPACEKECIKSDKYILEHLHEAYPAISYKCPHGLIDNATPIIIDGKHLGNFFTGQFFLEKPDLEFFRQQAKKFDFDENSYLEAVERVPVWTRDKLHQYLDFVKGFIEIISGLGLKNLREIESRKVIVEYENRLNFYTEKSQMAVIEWDSNFAVSRWSHSAEKMFGWSEEETLGKPLLDLKMVYEPDLFIAHTALEKQMKCPDECIQTITRNYRKDGKILTCEWYNTILKDENGKLLYVLSQVLDITDRKHSEESLQVNEARHSSMIANISDVIGIIGMDGIIKYKSPNIEKWFGWKPEDLIGTNGWLTVHPDDLERIQKEFFSLIQQDGTVKTVEYKYRCKDGSFKMIELTAKNLINDPNINGALLNYHDISERIKVEEKLFERDSDLIRAEKIAKIGHWKLILTSKLMFSSAGAREIYGVEEDALNFHEVQKIPLPEYREMLEKALSELVNNGVPYNVYFKILRARDNKIIDIHSIADYDKKNKIVFGVIQDITGQKQIEQEFINAKEHAEESDRLKSAFLANMSHEIRTPMNGILGFTDLLKNPNLSGEKQQKFIEIIEKSGHRMLNTINNIVDISKIESGLMQPVVNEVNINEQLQFAYSFFRPEAENKGLQLLYKSGIPSENIIIQTDHEKIYSVLSNLIKNAIKFTDNGSVEFGFEVVDLMDSFDPVRYVKYLKFFVKDTGIGIPKESQNIVFERFRQTEMGHTRAYEGTGLGLSIAKSYVEMLGGKIWLESGEAGGTVFYFTIPYKVVSSRESSLYIEENKTPLKKLKILIAEDDETSGQVLEMQIEDLSKEILIAENGVQAVDLCRKNADIDLVLMDIRMPKMDGHEATRQIRQFNKDVIIIAQTANGFSTDREEAIIAGCNDYISKPINYTRLHAMIRLFFTQP